MRSVLVILCLLLSAMAMQAAAFRLLESAAGGPRKPGSPPKYDPPRRGCC